MSDWEDIFGEGYSDDSLIAFVENSHREPRRSHRRGRQGVTSQHQAGGIDFAKTFGRPSHEEHRFSSFDEALRWEKNHPNAVFVRRPEGSSGYVMRVYPNGRIAEW